MRNFIFHLSAFIFLGLALPAQTPPTWWADYNVTNTNPANDPAVATVGQAKYVAFKANEYLDTALADVGGSGQAIDDLLAASWFTDTASDNRAILIGELKTFAAPFYDRINTFADHDPALNTTDMVLGDSSYYPWTEPPSDETINSQPATLGQLKFVFSFDLADIPPFTDPNDRDGDGLSNDLEIAMGYDPDDPDSDNDGILDGDEDYDEDGITNLAEVTLGSDPLDYLDENENDIPDILENQWALVTDPWKEDLLSSPLDALNDPDDLLTGIADIDPLDDLDGDGINNISEYLLGTDAADYYNGQSVELFLVRGDRSVAAPGEQAKQALLFAAKDAEGNVYNKAPMHVSVVTPSQGSVRNLSLTPWLDSFVARSVFNGLGVEFQASPTVTIGQTVIVRAAVPGKSSVDATMRIVSTTNYEKRPPRDYRITNIGDGTFTHSWVSDADQGDTLTISDKEANGTSVPAYTTTYGSTEVPFVQGVNTYSVTLDASYNYVQ